LGVFFVRGAFEKALRIGGSNPSTVGHTTRGGYSVLESRTIVRYWNSDPTSALVYIVYVRTAALRVGPPPPVDLCGAGLQRLYF